MRALIVLTLLGTLSFLLGGCVIVIGGEHSLCISGKGPVITQERDLPEFHSITLASEGVIFLSQGEEMRVRVEAQETLMPHILTSVSEDTLEIDQKECFTGNKTIRYYITMKEVQTLHVEGSADIQGQTLLQGDEMEIGIFGSGDIKLEAHATRLVSKIHGSGDISVSGQAQGFAIDIRGSGDVAAEKLTAAVVEVSIEGSGNAKVHAVDEISVSIQGSGDVLYTGRPVLGDLSIEGSGNLKRAP